LTSEIERLAADGYEVWLLSGDTRERVQALADMVGLPGDRAVGSATPQGKADWIAAHDRGDTLMIGDGINDSLVVARATCSGTPVVDRPFLPARTDFHFVTPGLRPVGLMLRTAHRVGAVVRRNLGWAIAYNVGAVGLAWAGSRAHGNDRRRSCPLAALAPLLEMRAVAWFSLQKDDGEDQIAGVPAAQRLVLLDARRDFERKAALVAALDLVISVDTSIAHLAGALARPLWVLLPFAPDWRWQLHRSDSPWYPTARVFRQPRAGEWSAVIAQVQRALDAIIADRK